MMASMRWAATRIRWRRWVWCVPEDDDTGSDLLDFEHGAATLGASN